MYISLFVWMFEVDNMSRTQYAYHQWGPIHGSKHSLELEGVM